MSRMPIAFVVALAAPAAHATQGFTTTLESEKPGIQRSTSEFLTVGVEDFDKRSRAKNQSFVTDFGGSVFRGTYEGVEVKKADQYGGADALGNYAVAFPTSGYQLDLSSTVPGGVSYFGFWLSALDRGNNLTFYSGGKELFRFSAADAKAFIDGLPDRKDYYCNPNSDFAKKNCGEPYAFLNFYARGGVRFDRVLFSQSPPGGGYETDNHTVGRWNRMSGTPIDITGTITGVPEPSSWTMLIAGFGLAGVGLRRRRHIAAVAH